LWIDSCGYDFKPHPVLHLGMTARSDTPAHVQASIISKLKREALRNGLEIEGREPEIVLGDLVAALKHKTGVKVVVLIDEYDAPILAQISNIELAKDNRKELHIFYTALKELADTGYIHFILVTGVTKFSKAGIFSGFNNLDDLTLSKEYAGICGFTLKEFDTYFKGYLPGILKHNKAEGFIKSATTIKDLKKQILGYYDGYTWDGKTRVLNPFSLIKCINSKELDAFWYQSGTPTFLVDFIRKTPLELLQTDNPIMTKDMLEAVEVENLELVPLLFQTGYLTIDSRPSAQEYILRYPNREVSEAYSTHIVGLLTEKNSLAVQQLTAEIRSAFEGCDQARLADGFRKLLLWLPHQLHVPLEHYYHSVLFSTLKALNFKVESEVSESEGDLDLKVELPGNEVFIIEFKYGKPELNFDQTEPKPSQQEKEKLTAETRQKTLSTLVKKARDQIEARRYADRFVSEGKNVHKVAVGIVGRTDVAVEIY
jgi:hypothetical protein